MDNDTRQGVKLLTSLGGGPQGQDTAGLGGPFVDSQRRVLSPRLDRLSPGNRERATASLGLLDSVRERSSDLRAGLACDTVTQSGSDAIGPKLRDCTTGAATTSTDDQPSGQGQKEATTGSGNKGDAGKKPKPTSSDEPAVDPTRGGETAAPGADEAPADEAPESPEPLITAGPGR